MEKILLINKALKSVIKLPKDSTRKWEQTYIR